MFQGRVIGWSLTVRVRRWLGIEFAGPDGLGERLDVRVEEPELIDAVRRLERWMRAFGVESWGMERDAEAERDAARLRAAGDIRGAILRVAGARGAGLAAREIVAPSCPGGDA